MASRTRPRAPTPKDPAAILRPTKEPDFRQERSRRSYTALIEAATELFSTHGYDAIGTPEISQRAGVSVGTFYRYFEDKHEVYLEITRRTLASAYEDTIARLTPARFVGRARHETIAETVAGLFNHILERPKLLRSFREMALRDPQVGEIDHVFQQMSIARLAELMAAIFPAAVLPDPEATAWVVYGTAIHAAYGLAEHVGPSLIPPDRATKALTDFIERALFPWALPQTSR